MANRGGFQLALYRGLAVEYLGSKCIECGSKKKLELHHRNGNWHDNSTSNIALLCVKHHRRADAALGKRAVGPTLPEDRRMLGTMRQRPDLERKKTEKTEATKPSHVNIRLTRATYLKLVTFAHKDETFDVVVARLMRDIDKINFEIISVDNESPANHSVTYIIGNAKYVYSKGKHALVSVP